MNKLDKLFKFNASIVTVKRSLIAEIWGMNMCIGRTIHLTYKTWNLYVSNGQKPNGTIYHEYVHHCQQQETGFIKFILLYLFCVPIFKNPYRRKWELDAYRITLAWRLEKTGNITPAYRERLAKILSAWRYGWMISYDDARDWIKETCKELNRLKKEHY